MEVRALVKYRQQGFTVIELVLVFVVLAIVAGLLAVALDVYRVRAQVSRSLEAARRRWRAPQKPGPVR